MATETTLRPGEIKDILLREIEAADLQALDVEAVGTVLEVRDGIAERDRLDSTRAASPLRVAGDAVTIDSTDLQPADVVARMRALMDGAPA